LRQIEADIKKLFSRVNEKTGLKEKETGLAPPSLWDLPADRRRAQEEQTLQVARCTKIISSSDPTSEQQEHQFVINVKQIGKFVVGIGKKVDRSQIEEGMRVGIDRNKYQIQLPLPLKLFDQSI